MDPSISPYLPIPPQLASSGQLVPIKQAAENNKCSSDTLRNNAKARNLRAFQQFFGGPVLVLQADVEIFLKSRPDIASNFHRSGNTPAFQPWAAQASHEFNPPWATQVAGSPPLQPPPPAPHVQPYVPPAVGGAHQFPAPPATWIWMDTLSTATPSELTILATFFTQISNHLNMLLAHMRANSTTGQQ